MRGAFSYLVIAAVLGAAVASTDARAADDRLQFVLSDGNVVEGRLVDIDEITYVVDTPRGEVPIQRTRVRQVTGAPAPTPALLPPTPTAPATATASAAPRPSTPEVAAAARIAALVAIVADLRGDPEGADRRLAK